VEVAPVIDELPALSPESCIQQVQRILQSVTFRNAVTLQQLLQYLVSRALDGSTEFLKEYTIGVEAFGRPQHFDPKTDTIVRVQIHRLRQKLREYYDANGHRDPILVEIPKGHYLPRFDVLPDSRRDSDVQAPASKLLKIVPANANPVRAEVISSRPPYKFALIAVVVILVFLAFGIWIDLKLRANQNLLTTGAFARESSLGTDPVKVFWARVVGDDPTPVIAYPDAVFLLDKTNDLFRFRQGASDDRGASVDPHVARQFASNPSLVSAAGALNYENGYTGVGELQAVAMLSGLFGEMGIRPVIKPSRDITPVDLRQHTVILLGSSFQNVAVARLTTKGDFSFKNPDSRLEQWRAEIVNAKPRSSEAISYHTERAPDTHVLRADYGIFSVQSSDVSGRHIVMLGGLDTTGTEGATMFATSKNGVEQLQKTVGFSFEARQAVEIPPFQALVQARLEKGSEVLGASLVTVHNINQRGSNQPNPHE
jgi:hypothetical protein